MTTPVGYVRRSSRAQRGSDGEISLAAQEAAVRDLAHRDGHNGDLQLFTDAGRSGDEAKISRRSEYARMLALVERGEVGTIYAYSLDRLHRSVVATVKLVRAAEEHGVEIVTAREGRVRNDSPDEWLRWTILATFGDYELRIAKSRARAATDARRARGDYLGVVPYGWQRVNGRLAPNPSEDVGTILEAYRAAGSFRQAALELNRAGVPARKGPGRWADQTVARILRREGLIGDKDHGGQRYAPVAHYLARLLACPHDGRLLVGVQKRRRPEWTVYLCTGARHDPTHPHPYAVAESKVLAWVQAEAARFSPPAVVDLGAEDERRTELEEDRRRAGVAYAARALTDDEFTATVGRIEAALEALGGRETAVTVPAAIDWQRWDRGAVNAVLRSLWDRVELGPDMAPLRVAWRLPAEYVR